MHIFRLKMMELDGTDSLMLCFAIHLALVHVFSAPSLYLSTALKTGRHVPWLGSTHLRHFTGTFASSHCAPMVTAHAFPCLQ